MSQDGNSIPQQNPTNFSNTHVPDKLQPFHRHSFPPTRPNSASPTKNQGTYEILVNAELKARLEYYISASIINTDPVGQQVLAATMAALGAGQEAFMAITVS